MSVEDLQLAEFLLDAGLLSRRQLTDAFERAQGKTLFRALLEGGAIGEDELRRASAAALGIPFSPLSPEDISDEALLTLPESFCRTHGLVAVALEGEVLEVALLTLEDAEALHALELRPPVKRLKFRLTDRSSLKRALIRYQKLLKERYGSAIQRAVSNKQYGALAEAFLRHALNQGATDAHVEDRDAGILVRYRLGGRLYDAMTMPKAAGAGLIGRLKALAQLPLRASGPQEGRFKADVRGDFVSVRVSTLPVSDGEKLVLHFAPERRGRRGFTLESLGFHGEGLEAVHRALAQKSGLVLVAGEEGSGKTTLLYTLLDLAASPERSLATLEEQIEFRHPHAAQTQVAEGVGFTFGSGLRALLRQDADVILIGDLRDEDAAALAVRAASRGKLVLAGMAAPSGPEAVERLLSLGVDPFLLASSLRLVIGTTLLRRLCTKSEAYRPARAELRQFESEADFSSVLSALKDERVCAPDLAWKDVPFYRPERCPECEGGYRDRVGVHGVIPVSAAVKELIMHGAPEEIERAAKLEGAPTRLEDGLFKAAQGLASLEELSSLAAR